MSEAVLGWLAALGGIGGPASGIVIALIVNHRNKQTTVATVGVSEKEAHTHEIAMIIDGFTESLAAVRSELKATTEKNVVIEKKYDALAERFDRAEHREQLMRRHIVALEELIPNPPGPPARPDWNL
jgi:hypothetical protein